MVGVDYYGISVIVAAVFAGIASVIGAWNARSASQIKTSIGTNGDSRELGQIATDVAKAVAPDPSPAPPTEATP
jgi:hypothetical protein